jgi:hypothetical protein
MYDFPSSPALNQVFGKWMWDGEKWVTSTGYGVPEAPTDHVVYGRKDLAWTPAVAKAGDTMTGQLNINYTNPIVQITKGTGAGTAASALIGYTNASPRWQLNLGDTAVESGSNNGSNFSIWRFGDTGTSIGTPLTINRVDGSITISGKLGWDANVYLINYPGGGVQTRVGTNQKFHVGQPQSLGSGIAIQAINDASNGYVPLEIMGDRLQITAYNGTTISGTVGQWPVHINGAATTGQSYGLLVDAGTNASDFPFIVRNYDLSNLFYVRGDGTTRANGQLIVDGGILVTSSGADITGKVWHRGNNAGDWASWFTAPTYGLMVQAGTGSGDTSFQVINAAGGTTYFSIRGDAYAQFWGNVQGYGYVRAAGYLWTDQNGYKPGGGAWADTSDARIKTVAGDYTHGLAEILKLSPRRYAYKGNDTPEPPSNSSGDPTPVDPTQPAKEDKSVPVVPYKNSGHYQAAINNKEFIGLIAQEAETVMPEMVTQRSGYIDGVAVTDIRELDTTPLIFALVNAVKTLTARIEALEGTA